MADITKIIQKDKLIPLAKFSDLSEVLPFMRALLDTGFSCFEIAYNSPCTADAISLIRRSYPKMIIGVEGVISNAQAKEVADLGAHYVVSPGIDSEIVKYCNDNGIFIIPGCVNASEIQRALSLNLEIVKFFPAEQSGGVATLSALCASFPNLKVIPTGGITMQNVKSYLSLSNVIACCGTFVAPTKLLVEKDIATLTKFCKKIYSYIHPETGSTHLPKRVSPIEFSVKINSDKIYDLVTLGEIMIRMTAPTNERISNSDVFIKHTAGAELNVAAGATSLGLNSALLTKFPRNLLTDYILSDIKTFGVCDKYIAYDDENDARLGMCYFEGGSTPRKPTVVYDRKYSSFTKLKLEDIDEDIFGEAKIFHTSGISLAVAETTCEEVIDIMKRFKNSGAIISFDVNFRANLWSEEQSYETIKNILPLVDILFISQESMRKMFSKTGELKAMMEEFCEEYNIAFVATTLREVISSKQHNFTAAIYSYAENKLYEEKTYTGVEIVDRVGSGDAFVGGALYGLVKHFDISTSLSYGCALAAYNMTMAGDLAPCTRNDIDTIISAHQEKSPSSEMNR